MSSASALPFDGMDIAIHLPSRRFLALSGSDSLTASAILRRTILCTPSAPTSTLPLTLSPTVVVTVTPSSSSTKSATPARVRTLASAPASRRASQSEQIQILRSISRHGRCRPSLAATRPNSYDVSCRRPCESMWCLSPTGKPRARMVCQRPSCSRTRAVCGRTEMEAPRSGPTSPFSKTTKSMPALSSMSASVSPTRLPPAMMILKFAWGVAMSIVVFDVCSRFKFQQ